VRGWLVDLLAAGCLGGVAAVDAAGGSCCCVSVSLRTETLKNRKEVRF
jgi:hypothetical protein